MIASSVASRISQHVAMPTPPPTQKPSILAMVGLVHGAQKLRRMFDRFVVDFDAFFGGSVFLKLGNVGAGAECFSAFAGDYDDAHGIVRCKIFDGFAQVLPHGQRHGVAAALVVHFDATNRAVLFDGQAFDRRVVCSVRHVCILREI